MKRISIAILALLLAATVCLRAQDEAAPTFAVKAGATELTPDQEQKAQENLDEAMEIYNDVLDYHGEGQLEAAENNLEYVEKRLARAVAQRESKKKQVEAVKAAVIRQYEAIQVMAVPQDLKDKKKRELKQEYDTQMDFLQFSIESLDRQIARLEQRRTVLQAQINSLSVDITGRPKRFNPDDPDSWQEVDAKRTDQAEGTFESLKRDEQLRRAAEFMNQN